LQNKLDAKTRQTSAKIIGTQVDLMNITFLYRLKNYHGVFGNDSISYLVPIHHKLHPEIIKTMADAADTSALIKILNTKLKIYANVFNEFKNPEQAMSQKISAEYAAAARSHPFSLAAICGFLHDTNREIKNTIITQKRTSLGLPLPGPTELF